jgi:hypothetical protein
VTDILASIYYCIWADVVVGLIELRKKYLAVKKKKKKNIYVVNISSIERVFNLESNRKNLYQRSKLLILFFF